MVLTGMLLGFVATSNFGCMSTEPTAKTTELSPSINSTMNSLAISNSGEVSWNEVPVSLNELAVLLERTTNLPVEPELHFKPDVDADYEISLQVLKHIRTSGVTKFGFVGNEKYVTPSFEED